MQNLLWVYQELTNFVPLERDRRIKEHKSNITSSNYEEDFIDGHRPLHGAGDDIM